MSISLINSDTSSSIYSAYKQSRQDFRAMASAIQSGDMSAAQSSLASLMTDAQNISSAQSASGPAASEAPQTVSSIQASGTTTGNSVQSDINALIQAIQSGNAGSAQQDLAALQNDSKSLAIGHHHHHSHMSGSAMGASLGAAATSTWKGKSDGNANGQNDLNASGSAHGTISIAGGYRAAAYAMINALQNQSTLSVSA